MIQCRWLLVEDESINGMNGFQESTFLNPEDMKDLNVVSLILFFEFFDYLTQTVRQFPEVIWIISRDFKA